MARYRKTLADSIVSKAAMRKAGVNELYLDAVEIDMVPFGLDVNANALANRCTTRHSECRCRLTNSRTGITPSVYASVPIAVQSRQQNWTR